MADVAPRANSRLFELTGAASEHLHRADRRRPWRTVGGRRDCCGASSLRSRTAVAPAGESSRSVSNRARFSTTNRTQPLCGAGGGEGAPENGRPGPDPARLRRRLSGPARPATARARATQRGRREHRGGARAPRVRDLVHRVRTCSSLRGVEGLSGELAATDPEATRNAKGWLAGRMPHGYDPVAHQLAFTHAFDLGAARAVASFDRLYRARSPRWHAPSHDRQDAQEADRGRAAAGGDQRGLGAGEVDPARAPVDAAPVVGAAAAGGGAGGDLRADGGRPVGCTRAVPDRGGAGDGARSGSSGSSKSWCSGRTRPTRTVLAAGARRDPAELARHLRRERGPPARAELFDRDKLPGFHDPFCRRRRAAAGGAAARARGATPATSTRWRC